MTVRSALAVTCFCGTLLAGLCALPALTMAQATTVPIAPPGSPAQDNATLNIQDVINEIRARGLAREADQLQKLLNEGRTFYRTAGPNKNDAQFVHGLVPGVDKDTLYFGTQHVSFVAGTGPQRYGPGDERRIALTIVVALHEMVHKDQSRTSIVVSQERAASRGYTLHEIEAYRTSMQKFVRAWIVPDLNAYLRQSGGMTNAQRFQTLTRLRAQLWALSDQLPKPGTYGDHACRWNAAAKALKDLSDSFDALWLDAGSKVECAPHLAGNTEIPQAAIDANLAMKSLQPRIDELRRIHAARVAQHRANIERRASLARQLASSQLPSHRKDLADVIGKIDAALPGERRQIEELRTEYDAAVARLRQLKAVYDGAIAGRRAYDQCRIAHVQKRVAENNLQAAQLPPDMVMNAAGAVSLAGSPRQLRLDAAVAAFGPMFDYDSSLASGGLVSGDARTPCHQTAGPKPADQPAKPKCKGGGLAGRIDCDVTDQIR